MKCLICKQGETQPGYTTVTLDRAGFVLVVRDVPAQVCANCGEAYMDEAVTARLLETAEDAAQVGAEVDVRRYVAA
jgi:YgiT-type zinc finger domain-containing protein